MDRLDRLESEVARLEARYSIAEIMLAFSLGYILRAGSPELRRDFLLTLRQQIKVETVVGTGIDDEETRLQLEEAAQNLIDKIERVARHEADGLEVRHGNTPPRRSNRANDPR